MKKSALFIAMSLLIGLTNVAHAKISKTDKVRPIAQLTESQTTLQNSSGSLGDDIDFSTLDNAPDPLAGIAGLNPNRIPLNAVSPETLKNFVVTVNTIRRQYVGDTNDEALFRYAMSGMLKKLDTYGEYLDKEALANLKAFTEGTVASVGLVVNYSQNRGHWVVDFVTPDSPSDKAGIKVGDYLHEISGIRLGEMHNNQDVMQMLSGIAGTQLDVVISHAGRHKHTVSLQRNIAESEGVEVSVQDGIALIRLPVFTSRTKDELIEKLVATKTPISAVLIDVRNNPGGVLASAIEVAGLFLANRPVVQVDAKNQTPQTLRTTAHAPLQQLPVMIVQNRYSASAAEVLAAAFLANGAIVAGETSYGKGSVQSILPINENEAVKLTTAYYKKANGDKIDGVGIVPNLKLDFDNGLWLDDALKALGNKKLAQPRLFSLPSSH